jgi:uncharacterized MAPEG superfamily protein
MWAHKEEFSLYRLENKLHGTGKNIGDFKNAFLFLILRIIYIIFYFCYLINFNQESPYNMEI